MNTEDQTNDEFITAIKKHSHDINDKDLSETTKAVRQAAVMMQDSEFPPEDLAFITEMNQRLVDMFDSKQAKDFKEIGDLLRTIMHTLSAQISYFAMLNVLMKVFPLDEICKNVDETIRDNVESVLNGRAAYDFVQLEPIMAKIKELARINEQIGIVKN